MHGAAVQAQSPANPSAMHQHVTMTLQTTTRSSAGQQAGIKKNCGHQEQSTPKPHRAPSPLTNTKNCQPPAHATACTDAWPDTACNKTATHTDTHAACSCTTSVPPGASSPTSAATPPHALTLSSVLPVALEQGRQRHPCSLLRSSSSPSRCAFTHLQSRCICDHPGHAAGIPETGKPATQPASFTAPSDGAAGCDSGSLHVKECARRRRAYQRRDIGITCRLLAAVGPMLKPQPHAAHRRAAKLKLQRPGAAIPISRAEALSLGQGACGAWSDSFKISPWLSCCAQACKQDKVHQPGP